MLRHNKLSYASLSEVFWSKITLTFAGITNGIDLNEWDPSTDEHIASHYSIDDLSGKVVKPDN